VVVGYGFCVDVESFNSVKEGSFFVAVQYLHNFVHRADETFYKTTPSPSNPISLNQYNQKILECLKIGQFYNYRKKLHTSLTSSDIQTDLKIALRTKNTIGNLLTHKNPTPYIYSQSRAYKLSYPDCNKAYIGQTGR